MSLLKARAAGSAALWVVLASSLSVSAQISEQSSLIDERPDAATVIVKQGEVAVTLGDLDTWMLDVPEKDRVGFIRSPERIENTLFQLLLMKQVNLEAKKAKLDQMPVVRRHMQMAADRTLARYQTESVRQAIKPPDMTTLAKEKYQANPESYREPDYATLVHVLITENERGSDAAKKLIDKLHRQAKKNPAKLPALATKYSEDPSAVDNKGELKNVSLATLDAEFAKATRSLDPGQLSAPVKSQYGWHIIRLDDIKRGRLPEFSEVEQSIKTTLEQEYIDRTFRDYISGLRERAMDPVPEVIANLPFRYGGEPEPQPADTQTSESEAAKAAQ